MASPPKPYPYAVCTYFRASLLLSVLLLTRAAAAAVGPPDLAATIHDYLESGGHQKLQRAFNLSTHVFYNPTIFLNREDGHERRDGRVVPRPAHTTDRPSDLQLLRAMGLHVPGVDPEPGLRAVSRQSQPCRDGQFPPTRIIGDKCQIDITYTSNTPSAVKLPVESAVRKWTAEFESSVGLRICFAWGQESLGPQTLGATTTPFFTNGRAHANLRDDSLYNPALASALEGEDMISRDQYHVHMLLNDRIPWHLDTNTHAPSRRYDLVTTVLHELTHGLFFSGTVKASDASRQATFTQRTPGRYDLFMRVEGDIGVVRSCTNGEGLYRAVTSPNLRFLDEASGTNFGLFAPFPFAGGSSVYHFNTTKSLNADCEGLDIAEEQCSDLMTHELVYGYTQRFLGETTLRVYRAMRSNAAGPGRGRACDIPDYSGRGPQTGTSVPDEVEKFVLPTWGIITVAVIGGIGAILVLGVIVSSVSTKR